MAQNFVEFRRTMARLEAQLQREEANLRKDLINLKNTVDSINTLSSTFESYHTNGILKELTQDELNTLISQSKDIILNAKSVKIIDCLSDYMIPALSGMLANNLTITNNDKINSLFEQTLNTLSSSKDINVFNELNSIIEIIDYLNEKSLLLPIINNDTNKPAFNVKYEIIVTATDGTVLGTKTGTILMMLPGGTRHLEKYLYFHQDILPIFQIHNLFTRLCGRINKNAPYHIDTAHLSSANIFLLILFKCLYSFLQSLHFLVKLRCRFVTCKNEY